MNVPIVSALPENSLQHIFCYATQKERDKFQSAISLTHQEQKRSQSITNQLNLISCI